MTDDTSIFALALRLLASGDNDLYAIIALSLRVSLAAVLIGCLIGIPLGAALAVLRFPGRTFVAAVLNSFMGLPPVVVGLLIYLLLSRSGPLGFLGLLYTPSAMIIAQTLLVTPIVAALSRQTIADLDEEYTELFGSLDLGLAARLGALIHDGRYSLMTAALAGFGRAIAEVGAVMIVGGNIAQATRVMTTAIALETSKGDLALAIALGLILIIIAMTVNLIVLALNGFARKYAYA